MAKRIATFLTVALISIGLVVGGAGPASAGKKSFKNAIKSNYGFYDPAAYKIGKQICKDLKNMGTAGIAKTFAVAAAADWTTEDAAFFIVTSVTHLCPKQQKVINRYLD